MLFFIKQLNVLRLFALSINIVGNCLDQVCCDGCNVWVHAECDKISSKLFKVPNLYFYIYVFSLFHGGFAFFRGH